MTPAHSNVALARRSLMLFLLATAPQAANSYATFSYPPSEPVLQIRIDDTIIFEWESNLTTPYFNVWGPSTLGSGYDTWSVSTLVEQNGSYSWTAEQYYAGADRVYWGDNGGLPLHVQLTYGQINQTTQPGGPNGPEFRVGPAIANEPSRTYALSATNPPLPQSTTTRSTSTTSSSTSTTSVSATTSAATEDNDGSGISGGAIAGIVVGVIAAVAVVVAAVVLLLLRRRRQTKLLAKDADSGESDGFQHDAKVPHHAPAELDATRHWVEADAGMAWELEGSAVPEKSVASDRSPQA